MKEFAKVSLMVVGLFLLIWVGKDYVNLGLNKSEEAVVNQDMAVIGSLKIEAISRIVGYQLKIRNVEALPVLLPEMDDGSEKSILVELVSDPQEWYRVAYEGDEELISSVGLDDNNQKLTLKIHLSEDEILKLSSKDRDWIFNTITLTALYALANEWETDDLIEQDVIVERLEENTSIELPFEIVQ